VTLPHYFAERERDPFKFLRRWLLTSVARIITLDVPTSVCLPANVNDIATILSRLTNAEYRSGSQKSSDMSAANYALISISCEM